MIAHVQPERAEWPWIAGRNELVRIVAARHHDAISDLDEMAAIVGVNIHAGAGPTWHELLGDSLRILESVGREIAAARTRDEVEAARLRHDVYERHIGEMTEAILGIAHRMLMKHPSARGCFVGYGRRAVGSPIEVIPPTAWEAGTPDWRTWVLTLPDGRTFHGIRLVYLDEVDSSVRNAIIMDLEACEANTARCRKAGRAASDPSLRDRAETWEEEIQQRKAGTTMEAAANIIAHREGLDPATVLREARKVRSNRPKRGNVPGGSG